MVRRSSLLPAFTILVLAVGSTPAAAATAAPAEQPDAWVARPPTYGVAVDKDVPITMSDGDVLDADVLHPAGQDGKPVPGRFPVVLTQTPYNKNSQGLNMRDDYLVQRGYTQIIVDVRGTGNSPGTWDSFGSREQRDGYELVQWADTQPYSDGRIALHGLSYGGINQLFTAAQQPPGLKAIFPQVPAGDTYRDVTGTGGQIDTGFIPSWLALVTASGLFPPGYALANPALAVHNMSSHAGDPLAFHLPNLASALLGGDFAYDGPFFRLRSPLEVVNRVTVPTFITGGEFDIFQRSEPLLYQRLAAAGVPVKLLFGPWYHAQAGGADLPVDGVPTIDELELRWFDHYVRGVPDPALDRDIAPVSYYQQGTNHYQRASSWPPAGVRYRPYQLAGPAAPGRPGALQPGQTGMGAPDLAPWAPVAGACSKSTAQWTAGLADAPPCSQDQQLNDLSGVAYDLPVTQPMRVAGPMAAHLTLSTGARDGQVTVRLEDVAPDGSSHALTSGWQVLSLRALDQAKSIRQDGYIVQPYHPYTRESTLPVPANTPMAVDVEIFPTAGLIQPGHRLRLAIQTADFPHLAAPTPQLVNSLGSSIQVWHDPANPSYVVLPEQ